MHNFRAIQKHVGKDVSVMVIVKSNAYGHGLVEITCVISANSGCSTSGIPEVEHPEFWFGVDSIDEALTLKKAGSTNPILILGYVPCSRLMEVIKNGFRFSLYDLDVLKESARIAKKLKKKAFVHIKIETGTNRQGVIPEDIAAFAHTLKKTDPYVVVEGAYTHFADTENQKSRYYKEQLALFQNAIHVFEEEDLRPKYRHAAASAATLLYPDTHGNMVRWGVGLYGLYPSKDVRNSVSNTLRLRPALAWKTRIAQVKVVPKGSTVGYDRAFAVSRPMKIAVVPVGYWDGYDRSLSNKGSMLIRGKKCPVAGNICMNMCMADVTTVPSARVGDEVVLLGKQGSMEITAEEVAANIGTINYEVVTRINPLIPRVVI